MKKDIEEWRDVSGYEGFYQVSSFGRLKRLAGSPRCYEDRIVFPGLSNGYRLAMLCKDSVNKPHLMHRLVVAAFKGPIDRKQVVNHVDGNKQNNRLDNLEVCSQSRNMRHQYQLRGGKVLHENEAKAIKLLLDCGYTIKPLSKMFGVSVMTIANIKKDRHWSTRQTS